MDFSRQTMELILEFKALLRQHGVVVSITDRHAPLHLLNASAQIEDDSIKQIRLRLLKLLPEVRILCVDAECQEAFTCERCESILQPVVAPPLRQYVACSCGQIFLVILGDQRVTPRHSIHLQGLYRSEAEGGRIGELVVEDLSYDGACVRTLTPHTIASYDRLTISFTLDDITQTVVHEPVIVTSIQGDILVTEFVNTSALNHALAAYLGLSWIRV